MLKQRSKTEYWQNNTKVGAVNFDYRFELDVIFLFLEVLFFKERKTILKYSGGVTIRATEHSWNKEVCRYIK
jgi:hypothetical protein